MREVLSDRILRAARSLRAHLSGNRPLGTNRSQTKIFCIGRNKTGTTSIAKAFSDLGYSVGSQRKAEKLAAKYYFKGEFAPIIEYCRQAEVFQDVPFSWPETYKIMDAAFPGSKFILSIRSSGEEWYESLVRYHSSMFGRNGRTPTANDLRAASYVSTGFMYNTIRIHGTPDDDPYNKDIMIEHYRRYNREVIDYFRSREDDFLVINLAEGGAYAKFLEFLGVESPYQEFPWENKS